MERALAINSRLAAMAMGGDAPDRAEVLELLREQAALLRALCKASRRVQHWAEMSVAAAAAVAEAAALEDCVEDGARRLAVVAGGEEGD